MILASVMAALFFTFMTMKLMAVFGIKASWDISGEILARMHLIGALKDDERVRNIRAQTRFAPVKSLHEFLSRYASFRRLAADLEMARFHKCTVFHLLCLCVAAGVVAFFIGDLLAVPTAFLACLAPAAAYLPLAAVRFRKARYIRDFESQLPNAIGMMAGCIKAGHTVESSLDVLSRHSPQPAAAEFGHVRAMIQLGQNLVMALGKLNERMPSSDIGFLIAAVTLQQKTGGSLSDCLKNLEVKMRDRIMLRREVKALTSEGRLTIWVLAAIPPVMLTYQLLTGSEALLDFLTSTSGRYMTVAAFGVQLVGVLWARKLVKVL